MIEWTDENNAEIERRVKRLSALAQKEAARGIFECHRCGGGYSRELVRLTDWGFTCETCNDDINKMASGS
jgi:transcription initiation factor IIE alpha subunit